MFGFTVGEEKKGRTEVKGDTLTSRWNQQNNLADLQKRVLSHHSFSSY